MDSALVVVVVAAFLASTVEAVEALTVVLAVGLTHGWRTALLGFVCAVLTLAVVVVAFGPALVTLVPLNGLRILVGVLLLIFGLQWLRKAILRAAGLKAEHDEAAIFAEEVAALRRSGLDPNLSDIDWTGFVVSFKGVFLEGLEVAFIVLTFGAHRNNEFGASALGAALAVLMVGTIGAVVHRPLTRVPENWMKFVVGLMLVAFGTFWGGEGIGIEWALQDAMIVVLVGLYAAVALGTVAYLKRGAGRATPAQTRAEA